MRRGVLIIIGVAIIALGAAALTELTLAVGSRRATIEPTVRMTSKITSKPASSPSPSPSATPSPTPVTVSPPTPTAAPSGRQATTNSFVRLRAQPNTASAVLEGLDGGTVVALGDYQDAQWQGVTVHGQSGYIYRTYLNY